MNYLKYFLSTILFFFYIISVGFGFQYGDVFISEDTNNIIFYFETKSYDDKHLKFKFENLDAEVESLSSTANFNSNNPTWNLEELILGVDGYYSMPLNNLGKKWRLILNSNLKVSDFENSTLTFTGKDGIIIESISLEYIDSNKISNFDLSGSIMVEVCSFYNEKPSNCDLGSYILVNNSGNYDLRLPAFINNTNVVFNTDLSLSFMKKNSTFNKYSIVTNDILYIDSGSYDGNFLIFSQNKFKILESLNLSNTLWESSLINEINFLTFGDYGSKENVLIYGDELGIWINDFTSVNKVIEYNLIYTQILESYSSYSRYSYVNYDDLINSTYSMNSSLDLIVDFTTLNIPNDSSCNIFYKATKIGDPIVNIIVNNETYLVDLDNIIDSDLSLISSNDIDGFFEMENFSLTSNSPYSNLNTQNCELKFNAGKKGDIMGRSIEFVLKNGSVILMDVTNLKNISLNSEETFLNLNPVAVLAVNSQNNLQINVPFIIDSSACFVDIGLASVGIKNDLLLNINGSSINIDTDSISSSGYKKYKNFNESDITDYFDMFSGNTSISPNLEILISDTCNIELGILAKGDNTNLNLLVSYGNNSDLISLDSINKFSDVSYDAQNLWIINGSVDIGSENDILPDNFEFRSSPFLGDVSKFKSCNIKIQTCFQGSGVGELELFFSSSTFIVNSSHVNSCSSGFSEVDIVVECSLLESKPKFSFSCIDCDDSNYFRLATQSSGNFYLSSIISYGNSTISDLSSIGLEPLISIYTVESLDYESVVLSLSCSELQGNDLLLSCQNCTSFDSVRVVTNESDFLLGVDTYESYEYDILSIPLSCDLLESQTYNFNCPTCDSLNFYTFPVFNISQGIVTYNSESTLMSPYFKVSGIDVLENSSLNLNIMCDQVPSVLDITCVDCDYNNQIIMSKTLSRNDDLLINQLPTNGGLILDVLLLNRYDMTEVNVPLNSCDIGDNITFSCLNCDSSNLLNLGIISSSSGNTYLSNLSNSLNFELDLSIYNLVELVGDELVGISNTGNLIALNSIGEKLFEKIISGFSYRYLKVKDLTSNIGSEIFVANSDELFVYSASGDLIKNFSNLNSPKFEIYNHLFVVNSDLNYEIYKSNLNLFTSGRIVGVDGVLVDIISVDVLSDTEKEYVIILKENGKTHFVIFNNAFTQEFIISVDGIYSEFEDIVESKGVILASSGFEVVELSLSPIAGMVVELDSNVVYSTFDLISDRYSISSLKNSVNSFLSSKFYAGIDDLFIPFSFITADFNPNFLVDIKARFEYNTSELVDIIVLTNITLDSRVMAGSSYYLSGVEINYKNIFAPLKINKFENLPGYVGGNINIYNSEMNFIETCESSEFQSIDDVGYSTGCDFGLFYSVFRDKDYLLYNDEVILVEDSGSILQGSILGNYLHKTIKLNLSYSNSTINYVISTINSLNTSDNQYSETYFQLKDTFNNTYINSSLVSVDNCYVDDFESSSQFVLDDIYTLFSFLGNDYYICSEVINLDINKYVLVSKTLNSTQEISFGSFGIINSRANIDDINFSSLSFQRDDLINLTYSVIDYEGDEIEIILQVYNILNSNWENLSQDYFGTVIGILENKSLQFSLDYEWTGIINYRVIVTDFHRVNKNFLATEIIEVGNFEVLNKKLNITKIDTGLSKNLKLDVFENNTLFAPQLGDLVCKFYQTDSLGDNPSLIGTVLRASGNSQCSLNLPSFYNPDTYYFYVVASTLGFDPYQSSLFNQTFRSELISDILVSNSVERSGNENLLVSFKNSEDNLIIEQGILCTLSLGMSSYSVLSDINGMCNFNNFLNVISGSNVCSLNLGLNSLTLTVSSYDTNKFFVTTASYTKDITIIDELIISIDSPINTDSFDPNDLLSLDLGALDSCGNNVAISDGDVIWEAFELSSGESFLISNKQTDGWIIPSDVFGSLRIDASVNSILYSPTNISKLLSVDDVINVQISSDVEYGRFNSSSYLINAQIVTGNGVDVSNSTYTGTWSGYSCDWYLDDKKGNYMILGSSLTNSLGLCSFTFEPSCSVNVGNYDLGVLLTGNVTPEFPISGNSSSNSINLYDDFRDSTLLPRIIPYYNSGVSDQVFYGKEEFLSLEVLDSCNRIQKEVVNPIWNYEDFSRNISLIFADGFNISFIPTSLMIGDSQLKVELEDPSFYRLPETIENITVSNLASIINFTTPTYLVPNSVNSFTCQVEILGISNKSFYNVDFVLDGVVYTTSTNSNGLAVLNFDSTSLTNGRHELGCSINDYTDLVYDIIADNSTNSNWEINLPSDLSIIGNVTFGNREYDLSKSDVGLIVYPVNMDYKKVFREGNFPIFGPEFLYAGIEFATIGAPGTSKAGQQILVDNANVTMEIYRTNGGVLVDTVSCIQDVEKDFLGLSNPRDSIDNYHLKNCNIVWNPNNLEVGEYNVVISASVPGQVGWTSQNYTGDFEIWGILNASLVSPVSGGRLVVNEDFVFTSSILDEFGTILDSSEISVDYYLRDASESCYGTLMDSVTNGSDTTFEKTINPAAVSSYVTDEYRLNDDWRIFNKAYAPFYETIDTYSTYETGPKHSCEYFWNQRSFIEQKGIDFDYPISVEFITPEATIIAPIDSGVNAGLLKFVCRTKTYIGSSVPAAPTTIACDGCQTFNISSFGNADNSGIYEKYILPDESDFDNSFNFTCSVTDNYNIGNGNRLVNSNVASKLILVSDTLGTGWGELPENYTFPTLSISTHYLDTSCHANNQKTWFKEDQKNSIFIKLEVGEGSSPLSGYRIEQSPISGTYTSSDSEGSLLPTSDSKCVRFEAESKLGGIKKYTFTVSVQDDDLVAQGAYYDKTISVYIDDVSPVIANITKDKSYYKSGALASVTVNLDPSTINVDTYADMDKVSYSVDTNYTNSTSKINEGSWIASVVVPVVSGVYTYNVQALDRAGYSYTSTFDLEIDSTNPIITLNTIDTGCGLNPLDEIFGTKCASNIVVGIEVSDNSLIDRVRIRGSGSIGTILDTGVGGVSSSTYSNIGINKNVNSLPDGDYTITYDTWDKAVNYESITKTFKVIKTGVNLNSLTQDMTYLSSISDTPKISGTVTSNSLLEVKELIIQSINECSVSVSSCNVDYDISASSFSEGANSLTVNAQDNLDNPTSKTFTFYLDTIDPIVSINSHSTADYVRSSFVLIANVTDINRDDSLVTYSFGTCSGSMSKISANDFSVTINTVICSADGDNLATVTAVDKSGKSGTSVISLKVDNTLPEITYIVPTLNEVVKDSLEINVEVTELNFNTGEIKLDSFSYDDLVCDSNEPKNCTFIYDTTLFSDGSHTLTTKVLDLAGNSKLTSRNFKIDNNAPTINIYKVENSDGNTYTTLISGSYVSGSIKVFATIVDAADEGNISSYSCNMDGVDYLMSLDTGNNYFCQVDSNLISDGNYSIIITAYDNLLNTNTAQTNLNIDNQNPIIDTFSFSGNLIKTGDLQSFNLSANEPLLNTCKIYYSVNGITKDTQISSNSVNVSDCSGSYSMTEGTGNSGSRSIIIEIFDRAGNSAEYKEDFILDNSAPVITSFFLTNAAAALPVTNNLPGVSPIENMSWLAVVNENNGIGNISSIIISAVSGINVDTNLDEPLNYDSGNNFTLEDKLPIYFGAEENTTIFEVVVTDNVGNIGNKQFTFFISNAPPNIDYLTAFPTQVEANEENVTINSSVTASPVDLKSLTYIITDSTGTDTIYNVPISDIAVPVSVNSFNFTPSVSGFYSVELIATNLGDKISSITLSNLFTAIGTTSGSIIVSPKTQNTTLIYAGDTYVYTLTTRLNNTGSARMKNAQVIFSGEGLKVNTPNLIYECGTILVGDYCDAIVNVTIDQSVGNGNKLFFVLSNWKNVDNSNGFVSDTFTVDIAETNRVRVISADIDRHDLSIGNGQNVLIGSIISQNFGNDELNSVSVVFENGTLYDENLAGRINIGISPVQYSNLLVGEFANFDLTYYLSTVRGNFDGYLKVSSTECVDSSCYDFVYTNITIFDNADGEFKINYGAGSPVNNITLIKSSTNYSIPLYNNQTQGVVDFHCSYFARSNPGQLLENYPVELVLNDGTTENILYSNLTFNSSNSSKVGTLQYLWNVSSYPPGDYILSCRPKNDNNNFVRAGISESINLTLIGNIFPTISYVYPDSCTGTLYLYDSIACNNINISTSLKDFYGYPVVNSLVNFSTDATLSTLNETIGSCYTDNLGSCSINWNPDVNTAGDYNITVISNKLNYISGNSSNEITVLGGYSLEILTPLEDILLFGESYDFNLLVKDVDGSDITSSLTYNTSWNLSNGVLNFNLSNLNNFSWIVNSSVIGDYLLTTVIETSNGSALAYKNLTFVRDTITTTLAIDNNILFRDSLNVSDIIDTNIQINVEDSSNLAKIQGASVTFKLNGVSSIGICVTDFNGDCNINWNPSVNLDAGSYVVVAEVVKENYFTRTFNDTSDIKVYVEPKWNSPSTISGEISDTFNIPLTCEIYESYKINSNPLVDFKTNFYMHYPAIFPKYSLGSVINVDGSIYTWGSESIANLTISGNELFVGFDSKINISIYDGASELGDLGFTNLDTISVNLNEVSSSVSWDLVIETGIGLEIISSGETGLTGNYLIGPSKDIKKIYLVFDGPVSSYVKLSKVVVEQTITEKTIAIGESVVLGSEFSSNPEVFGDLENFQGEDVTGFSSSANVETSSDSLFSYDGTKSIKLNVSGVGAGDAFSLMWNSPYSYDISMFKSLGFGLSVNDNLSTSLVIRLVDNSSCFVDYNIGVLGDELFYPDVNITDFVNTCSSYLESFELMFTNIDSVPLTGSLNIDRFELYKSVDSENALANVNFYPFEYGDYRYSCEIFDTLNYVVLNSKKEKIIKFINSGSDDDSGIELGGESSAADGVAASLGSVLSFELDYVRGDYIVPVTGKGLLEVVRVFNKLSGDRIFNISSSDDNLIKFNGLVDSSIVLDISQGVDVETFNIYFNTENVSETISEVELVVTDIVSLESISVPIFIEQVLVDLSIITPTSALPSLDVLGGNSSSIGLSVEFNSSASFDSEFDNFSYQFIIGEKDCDIDSYFRVGDSLSIGCIMPFVNSNEFMDLILKVDIGGIKE